MKGSWARPPEAPPEYSIRPVAEVERDALPALPRRGRLLPCAAMPSSPGTEIYYVFAIPAALFFALAAIRISALRRYRRLLDLHEPARFSDSEVRGLFGGRRSGVGYAPSDFRQRPSFVQAWVACASSIRMSARQVSAATRLRRLFGVIPDQKTGVDELDRRFYFDTDDPARLRAAASRIEFVMALDSLADAGVDLVRLDGGVAAAQKRATWIVPIGSDQVRKILDSLGTLAATMEAVAPGEARLPDGAETPLEPPPTTSGPGRLVFGGIVFLALLIGAMILGAFWEPSGWLIWTRPERWALVRERIPATAMIAFAGGVAAATLSRWSALRIAVLISLPVLLNALLVWGVFLVARTAHLPGLAEELASHRDVIQDLLATVTSSAGAVLGGSGLGALIGSRFRVV